MQGLGALWALVFPDEPPDVLESEAAAALRTVLHLNVAACALKREDWYLAREACTIVLAREPTHPKALYRLAQAHEGAGETVAALRALAKVVKADGQNREARQLWQRLKEQDARDRAFFGGTAAKPGFGGTDAPPPPPPEPEREDPLTQRIRSMLEAEERAKELGLPLPGEH